RPCARGGQKTNDSRTENPQMTMFQGAGALFALVAVFGYVNHRFVKLPDTLGITAVGLFACLCMSIIGTFHPAATAQAQALARQVDFSDVVFHGLLSLLLFAG